MMNKTDDEYLVFTPANEPYLGRESVRTFDEMICACMEANIRVAPLTHKIKKTDMQEAACRLLPQGISIALSIRELVRQGYLYGASVLLRSFIERVAVLRYLQAKPNEIAKWKRGWRHDEAPSLAAMLDVMKSETSPYAGRDVTCLLNGIVHGKPDSADWNVVFLGEGHEAQAPSKILNNPKLCDTICFIAVPMLTILLCSMTEVFPESTSA